MNSLCIPFQAIAAVALALAAGCTQGVVPLPANIAQRDREAAERLAELNASIETGSDGHVIGVSFYYDPDANNPRVSDTEIACLSGLRNLERLDISDTEVTDAGLRALASLVKLRSLSLPRAITDGGAAAICHLLALEDLHIDDSKISNTGLLHLSALTNITRLDIRNTDITGEGLKHLSTMRRLRCLCLGDTAVADGGLEALNDLPALCILDLGWTAIKDHDLRSIEPTLSRLCVLNLYGARDLTDHSVDIVQSVAHLKTLVLPEQVTEVRRRTFREESPACKIDEGWHAGLSQCLP